MNAEEIIRKMEEIEEEGLPPIEFARKSAEVFNKWAEENPGEITVLTDQRPDWCAAYAKRVCRRMEGIDWATIWGSRTTQETPPSEENMP